MTTLTGSQTTLRALIDRPAREALTRAQAGTFRMIAPLITGLALAALSAIVGEALAGKSNLIEATLIAMLQALALATPVFLVAVTLAIPSISPTTTFSGLSVSVAVAGLSSLLVLPLLVFLHLCAGDAVVREFAVRDLSHAAEILMAPATFLLALPVVSARLLRTFDSEHANRLAWLLGVMVFTVFLLRLPTLHLFGETVVVRQGWGHG
ncbi:MAG: hypothetical protein JNM17_32055 [Archangium sp.]|nr:hypothetical protein [Archangium sp.]